MRKAVAQIIVTLLSLVLGLSFAFAEGNADSGVATKPTAEETITIRVWDHFQPLKGAHDAILDRMKQRHPNLIVEHTVYNPANMKEALQLAYQSGQLPDIITNQTGIPSRRLVDQGWFVPIEDYIDIKQNPLVAQNLFEGLTVFHGKAYSVPSFNRRWMEAANWVNKDLMKQYGIDADRDLTTYDDVLKAAKTISQKSGGKDSGIVLPLQFTGRMRAILIILAMGNGASGTSDSGAVDWHTGKYIYDSEPFVKALEFLLAFQKQKTLYPSSLSLDARNARARWAAGGIGMFFDGPWNIGSLYTAYPDAVPMADVVWMPVASKDAPGRAYASPPVGEFFLTAQGKHKEIAAEFFQGLMSEEYYIALAKGQDQPPLDMDAIAKAGVHASYVKVNEMYSKHVLTSPMPEIRNPAVSEVITEMRPVKPDLGDIVQGVFSGAIPDIRAALQDFNKAMTAERDRAISTVRARGGKVSLDDWIFKNWDPSKDYTPEMYKASRE